MIESGKGKVNPDRREQTWLYAKEILVVSIQDTGRLQIQKIEGRTKKDEDWSRTRIRLEKNKK